MGTKHSKAAAYWALLLRVVSWLARINNGSRPLSRRDIGACVLQRPVAGCRPDYQRRAVKAVAIAQPKPFPLDPEPKLEGEFCKIVGGVITEPCPVPLSLTVTVPSSRTPALSHLR